MHAEFDDLSNKPTSLPQNGQRLANAYPNPRMLAIPPPPLGYPRCGLSLRQNPTRHANGLWVYPNPHTTIQRAINVPPHRSTKGDYTTEVNQAPRRNVNRCCKVDNN
jgi:hypothetical protein